MRTLLAHVRWDRLGLSILAILLVMFEYMSDNYPAMMFAVTAGLLMFALFRQQDKTHHAMRVAVHFAETLHRIKADKKDD